MADDRRWWTRWVVGVGVAWLVVVASLFVLPVLLHLERGEAYALGQVVVEVLLLPVVALGFVWTYREVRNALAPERLDLGWHDEWSPTSRKQTTMSAEPDGESEKEGQSIALFNTGKTVARWFVVEILLPSGICIADEDMGHVVGDSWGPAPGTGGGTWDMVSRGESLRVVFTSNGAVASFPNVPLRLGTVWHEPGRIGLGEFRVPYTIHTERGGPVSDHLTVTVESIWGS